MRKIIIYGDLQKQTAKDLIDSLPGQGKFEVRILKHVKRRSVDQNVWFWKWMEILSEHTGYSKKEMHDIICANFISYGTFEHNGKVFTRLGETSALSTVDFNNMMDEIYRWALNELGVLLPYPEDRDEQEPTPRQLRHRTP